MISQGKPDEMATKIYQKIFGEDVVKICYINRDNSGSVGDDGSLPTGGGIVLELHNGHMVEIFTSEWGGAIAYIKENIYW